MKKSELKVMFTNIPTAIGLGSGGQNGTVFTLKEPLRVKEDAELIKKLEDFLMSLPVAKRKAKGMKRQRQELFCLPAFRRDSQSHDLVYGLTFRDLNEIAG